jgi:hypothetical protein
MEKEGSLQCLQEIVTGSLSELVKSIPKPDIPYLEDTKFYPKYYGLKL